MIKKERDDLNAKLGGDMIITPDDKIEFIAYALDDGIVDYSQPVRVSVYIDDIKVITEAMKEGVL